MFAFSHFTKKNQIFLYAPIPVGAVISWLCEGSSICPDFLLILTIHVGFFFFYQDDCKFMKLFKIIRCEIFPFVPVESEPLDVFFIASTNSVFSFEGLVSSNLRLHLAESFSAAIPKFRHIEAAWPM